MGYIRERLQEIRLPAEESLCRRVLEKEAVRTILRHNPHFLVVGTDEQLSLAKEIWKAHPEARLTVVEMNPAVVRVARENVPPGKQVHFLARDVFAVKEPEVEGNPQIAVAKHLIHWFKAPDLVIQVGRFLKKTVYFLPAPRPWLI